jgi:hypothetical protein
MTLPFLTVIAGAILGGGLAIDLTVVVVLAVAALVLIAAINGARIVRRIVELFPD